MAAKRSKKELGEVSAFIRALYEEGGYARWSEFADEAGVHRVSLSNWQNAEVGPDGYNVLRLIRAAARRTHVEADDLAVAVARQREEGGTEESTDRRLDELAGLVTEALTLLRDLRPAQPEAPPQTSGGHPSQKSAAE